MYFNSLPDAGCLLLIFPTKIMEISDTVKRMVIILINKYAATERCIIPARRHNEILDDAKSAQWEFCGKSSASISLLDFYLTTIKYVQ